MRAGGLEGHRQALPGGVHGGVGDVEALRVEALEDLHAYADPRLRAGGAPARQLRLQVAQQRVEVRLVVGDAQIETVGRALAADAALDRRAVQLEVAALQRGEVDRAGGRGLLAVGTLAFRIGCPVVAFGDGLEGALEQRLVAGEQVECGNGCRHGGFLEVTGRPTNKTFV
ncbi:hypothetical protein D3C75_770500 [compost metagenome]